MELRITGPLCSATAETRRGRTRYLIGAEKLQDEVGEERGKKKKERQKSQTEIALCGFCNSFTSIQSE